MCPFQSVRPDRNRVFGHPVLPNFHPEGPVSQQELPVESPNLLYHMLSQNLIIVLQGTICDVEPMQSSPKKGRYYQRCFYLEGILIVYHV